MASQAATAAQLNVAARNAVLSRAVEVTQLQPNAITWNPSASGNYTQVLKPSMVGLITDFWIKVSATINNSSTTAGTATTLGLANLISNITLIDVQNFERINTSGLHLGYIEDLRQRKPTGQTYSIANATGDQSPLGYGNNYAKDVLPASLAASGNTTVVQYLRIPLRYDNMTLRGALYAQVINQTASLQITLNSNIATTGTNPMAVYNGSGAAGTITSATIELYQTYLDQLPVDGNGNPILPLGDLGIIYEFKKTTYSSLSAGVDAIIPYQSNRTFLSTLMLYNNGGALIAGSDINYFKLKNANSYTYQYVQPEFLSMKVSRNMGLDLPAGVYMMSHRQQPIATNVSGNIALYFNPSTVNPNALFNVYYEDTAIESILSNSPSIANQAA